MLRTILVYGAISGAVIIIAMILGMVFAGDHGAGSQVFGYLMMIIGLSVIFIAVKRHRDNVLGGVIKFLPAFGIGLAIAVVAGIAFVAVWEVYLAMTDYAFMDQYVDAAFERLQAENLPSEELDARAAELDAMREAYANPLYRLPLTFTEIFPIGLLISLVSAALLRNPNFAPKR
ncbi:MAG: DUF4199 domain-containing protein [Maricaulaceae bacterium]|jgi:hypothetical protein